MVTLRNFRNLKQKKKEEWITAGEGKKRSAILCAIDEIYLEDWNCA
jgi:hypothetical protein